MNNFERTVQWILKILLLWKKKTCPSQRWGRNEIIFSNSLIKSKLKYTERIKRQKKNNCEIVSFSGGNEITFHVYPDCSRFVPWTFNSEIVSEVCPLSWLQPPTLRDSLRVHSSVRYLAIAYFLSIVFFFFF